MDREPTGINHTIFLYGIKFTLIKTQKGYRGNFEYKNQDSAVMAYPVPVFQGYTFKQALARLMYKAAHKGLISLEDYNKFVDMDWKTPIDIQVWSGMNRLQEVGGKHYFKPSQPNQESEEDL